MENKILICVPTAEFARRADFYDYFNLLEKPEGTIVTFVHGQSPARNRNVAIEQAMLHKCSHILFIDDDVVFKSDLLNRLLTHDKDIVTGLYLMRAYPHQPIIFAHANEKGECLNYYPQDDEKGLIEVTACGLGCVLIKMEVFEALEKPYVRLGELEKDHWCDDIGLFRRVREKGFKIYCDLDCQVGHYSTMVVRSEKNDAGQWITTYDSHGTGKVVFPSIKPPVPAMV